MFNRSTDQLPSLSSITCQNSSGNVTNIALSELISNAGGIKDCDDPGFLEECKRAYHELNRAPDVLLDDPFPVTAGSGAGSSDLPF